MLCVIGTPQLDTSSRPSSSHSQSSLNITSNLGAKTYDKPPISRNASKPAATKSTGVYDKLLKGVNLVDEVSYISIEYMSRAI